MKKRPVARFWAKRKINPIVLKAIKEYVGGDISAYIDGLLKGEVYPFDYSIDLSESSLSKSTTRILNSVALQERQTMPDSVKGAKSIWEKIKDWLPKGKKAIKGKEEQKNLNSGNKEAAGQQQSQEAEQPQKNNTIDETEINQKVETFFKNWAELEPGEVKNKRLDEFLREGGNAIAKRLGISDVELYQKVVSIVSRNQNVINARAARGRHLKLELFETEEVVEENKKRKRLKQDENGKLTVNQAYIKELAGFRSYKEIAAYYFQSEEDAKMIFDDEKVKAAREEKGKEK